MTPLCQWTVVLSKTKSVETIQQPVSKLGLLVYQFCVEVKAKSNRQGSLICLDCP